MISLFLWNLICSFDRLGAVDQDSTQRTEGLNHVLELRAIVLCSNRFLNVR